MLTNQADTELLIRAAAFAKIPAVQPKPEQRSKIEAQTAELLQIATEALNPVEL